MLEGSGTVTKINKTYYIRIPIRVAEDSAFPFKANQEVPVKIVNGKLIVGS